MTERTCPDCGAELYGRCKRDPLCAAKRQRAQTRRWKAQLAIREQLFAARVEAALARSFEPQPMRVARVAEGAA
jgi:hypothetical protein